MLTCPVTSTDLPCDTASLLLSFPFFSHIPVCQAPGTKHKHPWGQIWPSPSICPIPSHMQGRHLPSLHDTQDQKGIADLCAQGTPLLLSCPACRSSVRIPRPGTSLLTLHVWPGTPSKPPSPGFRDYRREACSFWLLSCTRCIDGLGTRQGKLAGL